jgi:hypothetical protein
LSPALESLHYGRLNQYAAGLYAAARFAHEAALEKRDITRIPRGQIRFGPIVELFFGHARGTAMSRDVVGRQLEMTRQSKHLL